ncbi:hypothetical protein [Vibrio phage LV6]|nr:hypothetical protein [Vibrio phage LV6]
MRPSKPSKRLRLHIAREPSTDQGTFGKLYLPNGRTLETIELPWRDNKTSISCIPAGLYYCTPWNSSRFGKVWHLVDVKGRSYILIHKGNVAGDASKGYKTNSAGCILIGKYRGVLGNQKAVLNSGGAYMELFNYLGNKKTFDLLITEG